MVRAAFSHEYGEPTPRLRIEDKIRNVIVRFPPGDYILYYAIHKRRNLSIPKKSRPPQAVFLFKTLSCKSNRQTVLWNRMGTNFLLLPTISRRRAAIVTKSGNPVQIDFFRRYFQFSE